MTARPHDPRAFLSGGGDVGAILRARDWSASPLGAPETWPTALRITLRTVLITGHPAFLFWGPDHLCFCNDACRASLGSEDHPAILGMPGRNAWPEAWAVIGPQVAAVMSGGPATWHEDQPLPIRRHGAIEEVHWTYSCSPVHDDAAPDGIGGVLILCRETTARVRAERRQDTADRLLSLLEQAPGFFCVLRGPEHRFELVNAAHRALMGGRDLTGLTVRDALPHLAAEGYLDLLAWVHRTGDPYVGRAQPATLPGPDGALRTRYVDFVYQPIRDPDGTVTGILCEGTDVTEGVLAQATLREGEALQRMLVALGDRLRPVDDAYGIMAGAAEVLGTALAADRVGYAEVEEDGTAAVYREWNPGGLPSLVGRHRLDAFGAARLAAFRAGRPDAIGDIAADPRLSPAEVEAFRQAGIAAVVVVPLVKAGRLSALLFVHAAAPAPGRRPSGAPWRKWRSAPGTPSSAPGPRPGPAPPSVAAPSSPA
ncbi:PAS domain-containing protein [Roseomonas sp. CCTCC AB2023176]|uniref:PAS domain-containing protein n=1 Tax=Roseomonas sp. CCTCC AB2023176 TaxID=3342640 RepID=UPI0035E02D17